MRERTQDEIRRGTVIYYDPVRGYGFIRDSETAKKYFMHVKSVKFPEAEIRTGKRVRFGITEHFDRIRMRETPAAYPVWLAEDLPELDPNDGHTNYFEEAAENERAERAERGRRKR